MRPTCTNLGQLVAARLVAARLVAARLVAARLVAASLVAARGSSKPAKLSQGQAKSGVASYVFARRLDLLDSPPVALISTMFGANLRLLGGLWRPAWAILRPT